MLLSLFDVSPVILKCNVLTMRYMSLTCVVDEALALTSVVLVSVLSRSLFSLFVSDCFPKFEFIIAF